MLRFGIPVYSLFATLLVIFSLFVFCSAHDCPAEREHDLHDEAKLHADLLCAYDSDPRPVKDHKDTVTVKVRFALKYLSFDSLEETVTIHSWVALAWKDDFLSWTPSDYGNIKEIQIESHNIWTPRLSLFNADATLYQSDSIYTTCLLTNDGMVTCVPHMSHTGMCQSNIRNWPYDVQNCTLFFGSWMHTGEQINFTFYSKKPVTLDQYQDGPGWKLLNVVHERLPGKYSITPNSTYPMLKYKLMLKRESGGPAAIIVIPSIVIVMLTLISLLMDIKDNTRLFFACFSLFAHFTYLSEIGYNIPKYSSNTPIILLFVRDSMIITIIAILETLLLMSIRRRTIPAYNWITTVNRLMKSGPGKYVVFTEFDPSDMSDSKTITEEVGSSANERTQVSADWIQFANLVNSCVLIVSSIVYLVLFCTYILGDR